MMKAHPSIAVSSPASLETLYFPFNYSPCSLPLLPHPRRSSWLPTASRPADVAPSPSVLLVFFFLCLRCTKPAGGGRGEGREREVSQQDSEAGPATVDSGWREGACGHRPGITGSKRSISSVLHPARRFPAGGCSGRSRAGSQVCVEPGRPRCFRSQGKHFQGASPCLFCKEQPLQPVRVCPWEKGGCLVNLVTRDDHGGIVGSLSAWAGWKLSSS